MKKGPKDWSPHHRADIEHVQLGQCLIILAPDWFHRGDFQKWRSGSGVATWHDRSPEGQDVFVHYTSIAGEGFRLVKDGEAVEYELVKGEKGFQARNVTRVPAAPGQQPSA